MSTLAEEYKDPFKGWYQETDFVHAEPIKETINREIILTELYRRVAQLENEVKWIKGKKPSIEEPAIKRIEILSLGNEKLKLARDIPVLLEVYEDEVIAKFVDVEVTGFGETEYEALDCLKNNLVSLYYELIEDEANLGPLPKRWLTVLKEIVREK